MRFCFRFNSAIACVLLAAITGAPVVVGASPAPSSATQISEIPDKFVIPEAEKDYLKRIEMIPMRDGVRLHTVIIIPKGAKDAPIILTRTPNNAKGRVSNDSPFVDALLPTADTDFARGGYIRDRGQTTVGTGPPDIVGRNSRLNVVQHSNIERPVLGNLLCYSIPPVMADRISCANESARPFAGNRGCPEKTFVSVKAATDRTKCQPSRFSCSNPDFMSLPNPR